jgi:hypothetical protein
MYDTPCSIDHILTQLTEQPKAIAQLTAGLPRSRLHKRPRRGEWSLNDELAHLRSCSDMWGEYIATISPKTTDPISSTSLASSARRQRRGPHDRPR